MNSFFLVLLVVAAVCILLVIAEQTKRHKQLDELEKRAKQDRARLDFIQTLHRLGMASEQDILRGRFYVNHRRTLDKLKTMGLDK